MTKVSVVIPTYGNPIYLKKAIQSVLQQTFKDLELIIVDDNDPGTEARVLTEQLVSQIPDSEIGITYIKHDHNKNGAAARNTGFNVAKGSYISLLDSDDEYHKQRISKCFDKLEQCPEEVAGVYTGCEFRKGGKQYHTHKNVLPGNFIVETLACTFMLCTGSNLFIRKKVIDELSGFDDSFFRHQDYEFVARVFAQYKLEAISEVLVIKNNENLNLPDVGKMIDIKRKYLLKFQPVIDKMAKKDQRYIRRKNSIEIAELALKARKISLAKAHYKKALSNGTLTFREVIRLFLLSIIAIIRK